MRISHRDECSDFDRFLATRAVDRRYLRAGETWNSDTVDSATRAAAVADINAHYHRRVATLFRRFLAVLASWSRPLVQSTGATTQPRPLVSQLVDDLVTAPHAPTGRRRALVAT